MKVYVFRVATRPRENDISFSPVFVIRCYSARRDGPPMPLWSQAMAEMPSSVTGVCRSVNATGRPAFGAFTCADLVRLCSFDPQDLHMEACAIWHGVHFLSRLKDQIQDCLNYAKVQGARTWREPYIRYFENEIPSPWTRDEMGEVDDRVSRYWQTENPSPLIKDGVKEGDDPYFEDETSSPLIKDEIVETGDALMDIPANEGENSRGVCTAEAWAGTSDDGPMETSSAGSSDLDTDSDISEILKMNGMSGVNGGSDTAMDLQDDSQNVTVDGNGDGPINNREVLRTSFVRDDSIEFVQNETL